MAGMMERVRKARMRGQSDPYCPWNCKQLGGVSYVYAVGRDGETKVTIQQKGHARIAAGASMSAGIEPDAVLAFDG